MSAIVMMHGPGSFTFLGGKDWLHLGSGWGWGRGRPRCSSALPCPRPGAGGFAFGWAAEVPGMVTAELAVDVAVHSAQL